MESSEDFLDCSLFSSPSSSTDVDSANSTARRPSRISWRDDDSLDRRQECRMRKDRESAILLRTTAY